MTAGNSSIDEFVKHRDWLRRLACSVVGENDADDLVQEVFLKAAHSRPELRGQAKGWLAAVLRNAARMRYRSDSRRTQRNLRVGEVMKRPTMPCERIERHQDQLLLQTMVSGLPELYRKTVLGLYVDGLSASELAATQGLKAATVRQRHKHALHLLRKQIRGEHQGAIGSLKAWLVTLVPAAATEMSGGIGFELYELGLLAL